jgi:hypothetical protein
MAFLAVCSGGGKVDKREEVWGVVAVGPDHPWARRERRWWGGGHKAVIFTNDGDSKYDDADHIIF